MRGILQGLLVAVPWISVASPTIPWGWAEGPSGRTELAGASIPADATNVAFVAGVVAFDGLALADRKLSFTADPAGTTIVVGGARSGFDLSGASGDWTFRGITFRGTGERSDLVYDGGAIACRGGRLTLVGCSFERLSSRFTGGAVSAYLMDGDVTVSNCTFTGNVSGPMNGMGGALYASRNATGAGTLRLDGSSFSGNSAQNGGAVSTVRVVDDNEKPMLVGVGGCTFRGNSSDYSGGAMNAEGALWVTNSLFAENSAVVQGGAICAGSSDPDWAGAKVELRAGTVFRGNSAKNSIDDDRYWTSGGAVAVAGNGYALEVSGRYVIFEDNRVESATTSYGGAIAAAKGTTVDVFCAAFLANQAGKAGGAVCSWGDSLGLSTSIFSNNTVTAANGVGGAVAVENGATLTVSNSTVRGSNGGAVDAYRSKATLVNCVVVDNGATDVSVGGGEGAELVAEYTSYGRAEVAEGTPVTTNACISGRDKSIYLGESLYLDSLGAYLPEACEGIEQEAWDFDGVKYGSRPAGRSMGAFECPTLTEIEIVSTTWYHNRSDGLYYPQIKIRFIGGDAHRIAGVTLTCGGVNHELPAADVARLRAAATGEVVSFGVDPATFVPYPNSPASFGFVPPENRLFGIHDASRPPELAVTVKGTLRMAEVVTVPVAPRLLTAARMPTTIPVRARFTEFRIGERLSGKIETAWDATVFLWGCASLGGEWKPVCPLEIDADGGFSTAVPDGLRFFRLEAEVAR